MYGGQANAAAFAAPLGSYLGDIVGWRGVFWALTPIAALNLVWHLVALPSLPVETLQSLSTFGTLLLRRHFRRGLVAIWGAMNTAMSVIWMSWMSRNVDDLPEAAGGLMVAVIQASILLGGVIGGFLLDLISIKATFAGSVLLAICALALIGTGQKLLKTNTES